MLCEDCLYLGECHLGPSLLHTDSDKHNVNSLDYCAYFTSEVDLWCSRSLTPTSWLLCMWHWLIDRLIDWWLTEPTDWLIDWLINCTLASFMSISLVGLDYSLHGLKGCSPNSNSGLPLACWRVVVLQIVWCGTTDEIWLQHLGSY